MRMKQTLLTTILVMCGLLGSGCAAPIAYYGFWQANAMREGTFWATEKVTVDQAWQAVHSAARNLNLPIISEEKGTYGKHSAVLILKGTRNREILISLWAVDDEPTPTRVSILVGVRGDEKLSQRILNEMRKAY